MEYSRKYYEEHKEELKAKQRARYRKNKERILAWHRDYRKTPKRIELQKVYNQRHQEKMKLSTD